MVQVKLGNQIISIRGRFGGVYFKTGKPGQHIQAMPRHVRYAHSVEQMGGVEGFSAMAAFWQLALLIFFGAAWAAFALAYMFTDKRGESKHITGYNWYIHYALTFPETEEPHFWKPPHSPYDLPNFVVSSGTNWHLYHKPDEMPPTYPGGFYWEIGPWNGKMSYAVDEHDWFLWWKDPMWVVSSDLGYEQPDKSYYSDGPEISGYYYNPVIHKYIHVYRGDRD